jgi:hypothetical protein
MIESIETFHDANLTVINDPRDEIVNFIGEIDDSVLIQKLVQEGSLDSKRRNIKIDTGFACGQCHIRDALDHYLSKPNLSNRIKDPVFCKTHSDLLYALVFVRRMLDLPQCHQVDGIDKEWAAQIADGNIIQSARNSLACADSAFVGHFDTENDPRELMSNVMVIHKMVDCVGYMARLAKIGYSWRSCYSAGIRLKLLRPILQQIISWYKAQPETRRIASNNLFTMHSSTLHGCVVFPVHFLKLLVFHPSLMV